MKTPTKRVALNIRNIPRTVRDFFKGTCTRRGDTMEDVIISMMMLYTESPEKFKISKQTRKPATVSAHDLRTASP